MTEHPEELLAEYVDGTLESEKRARVEAHLSSCTTCGGEVEAAHSARAALQELPELEEPPGVAFRGIKESRRGPPRRWVRSIAAAGAAAAVIGGLVAFVAFLALGDGSDLNEEAAGPAAGAPVEQEDADAAAPEDSGAEEAFAASVSFPQLRPSEGPLDAEALPPLARDLRGEARSALREGFPSDAATFYEGFELSDLSQDAADALGCVTDAFAPGRSVVPFVILDGRFEGEPSYIASFLQGPAPDQGYDRVVLIVADRADCELRTVASQRL